MTAKIKSIVVPATEAPLDSVVVYPNAAKLKRNVKVQVNEGGEYQVEFQLKQLQRSLYQDSVSVKLAGTPYRGLVVTIIKVQTGFPDSKTWYEEFEKLDKKIISLEEENRLMAEQHSAAVDSLIYDDEQQSFEGGLTLEQSSAELLKMERTFSEMNGKLEDLANKIHEHAYLSVPFAPHQKPADQLDNIRQAIYSPRLNIRVHISVKGVSREDFPMEITGSVGYVIAGCYWHPRYELRMCSEDLSKVEMSYLAHITQDSSEDWDNIKVALHSAWDEPPALLPLVVEVENPASPRTEVKELMVHTDGVRNHSQAAFDLLGLLCIPSDNKSHRFIVAKKTFKTNVIFYCTPEISRDVFRAGSCKNDSDYLFLAGPVSVFWDGALVASTNLNAVSPGESFYSFFGKEQLVKLVVSPQREESPKIKRVCSGQADDQNTTHIKHTVDVINHCRQPVNVMAVFRLPRPTANIGVWVKPNVDSKCSSVEYDSDMQIEEDAVFESLATAADGTVLWVENKTTNHVAALAKLAADGKTTLKFGYFIEGPGASDHSSETSEDAVQIAAAESAAESEQYIEAATDLASSANSSRLKSWLSR